jgi:hypothetical protein
VIILLTIIAGYSINDYLWIFYWWILMLINGYSIGGYWLLLMAILLRILLFINGYSIGGYWWLFY